MQESLRILSSLDSRIRHQAICLTRTEGTGSWLLQDERFLQWRDRCHGTGVRGATKRTLSCYGHPGVGKTVMTCIIVDELQKLQLRDRKNVGVAVIYCDYRDQTHQSVCNILGSILEQFLIPVMGPPLPPAVLDNVFRDLGTIARQRRSVVIEDITQMLRTTLAIIDRAFICIDALDELGPGVLYHLLTFLGRFQELQVFLTARPRVQPDVNRALGTDSEQYSITIFPDEQDIRRYLEHALELDSKEKSGPMNHTLKQEILTTITENSKHM
ncbi:hypothetical protein DFH27DRAFT_475728 [Peziza echinospora]|nr:hypothetical protein DFH27DRAFT_475728 [Peziza echinospora]